MLPTSALIRVATAFNSSMFTLPPLEHDAVSDPFVQPPRCLLHVVAVPRCTGSVEPGVRPVQLSWQGGGHGRCS
jgi:hypothetical protein